MAFFASIYFVFQSRVVQTAIISAITKNIAQTTNTQISIRRVNIALFRSVVLDDVYMSDQQNDTLFYAEKVTAKIDSFSFFKKRVHFKKIAFENPIVNIYRIDSTGFNFDFLQHVFTSPQTKPGNWKFFCSRFELEQGSLAFRDYEMEPEMVDLLNLEEIDLVLDETKILNKNNLSLAIKKMSFKTFNGFILSQFSTSCVYADSIFKMNAIKAKTSNSSIQINTIELALADYLTSKKAEDISFKLDLKSIDLGIRDLSFFIDSTFNIDTKTKMSGKLYGNMLNLRGRDLQLSVENFTSLNADFSIDGLNDLKSAYIFLNLNESYANLNEIRNLDLPPGIEKAINNLPAFFDNVGTFSYKGNFTGFLDDFVAYGTAYSNLGIITSDISFKPTKNEKLHLSGSISTYDLNIRKIFDNQKLNKLSLKGEVNGIIDKNTNYDLVFNGLIDAVDFNDYTFQDIELNGTMQNNLFNGYFSIFDPNLQMEYNGKLDLQNEIPVFEFIANIDHAHLFNLNLIPDSNAMVSLDVDANFEGNNIDNMKGRLTLSKVYYSNNINNFSIDEMVLNNTPKGDTSIFTISSDVLDGKLIGHYNFLNIGPSLIAFYQRYLPSSYYSKSVSIEDYNAFDYQFNIKNVMPFIRTFKPELYIESNFEIKGNYNPNANSLLLETEIPFLRYKNQFAENLNLKIDADDNRIHIRTKTDKLSLGKTLNIYNLSVESEGKDDELLVSFFWNNFEQNTYSGKITTLTKFERSKSLYPKITTNIEPSYIYFSDSLWVIDETKISIDSTSITFNELCFHHKEQKFLIDGKIANNKESTAYASIKNVDLLMFEPLLGSSYFTGRINGNAKVVDFYEKLMLDLELTINDLAFDKGYLGELSMKSNWDFENENLKSKISLIKDDLIVLNAIGVIDPLKSGLDMNVKFDNSPLSILEVTLPSIFNNQHGYASGNLHIHGKFKHILHDGVIQPVTKSGMGLSYLNTTYYFTDPVYFSNDSIQFKKLKFEDKDGNKGLLNGSIKHTTFNNLVYDLNVESKRLLALNTTSAHNDYFYGTAYVSGNIDITGAGSSILLSGDARSEKGTNVYIPFESGEDAEQFDFIEFVNNKVEVVEENKYNVVTTGLDMNFDLELTPDAKVQIIFNSKIGDIIKGSGNGNLQVKVDRNYNINMYGNYVIEEGDYLFTLSNVINKRFTIERGGTIEWVGDPYEALINIKAVYKVKTSLYDLFVGDFQDIDLARRIPVDCGIQLTDKLTAPKIDFSINLPTAEERIKDQVSQLIVTKEEINKQIISLLMLGRFFTPEFFAGKPSSETGKELVGTTASELISNQLSNWLSQISDVLDVGVNYRPGNEISNDQIELALSTQILNDRITLNGNIGNNANPNTNNNKEIIGDFDLNIKLTDNGKLQFKAYNHSNDNVIYDTPYTQGVGFSFREEFNSIGELYQRYKEAIIRKSRKKVKMDTSKSE